MNSEKQIFAKEQTWLPTNPIVVGEVIETSKEVRLRKQQKLVYDERGPLPLNLLSSMQEQPAAKHTIIVKKKTDI